MTDFLLIYFIVCLIFAAGLGLIPAFIAKEKGYVSDCGGSMDGAVHRSHIHILLTPIRMPRSSRCLLPARRLPSVPRTRSASSKLCWTAASSHRKNSTKRKSSCWVCSPCILGRAGAIPPAFSFACRRQTSRLISACSGRQNSHSMLPRGNAWPRSIVK